jgi:conjugal transfer pilus assembly protein TraF
MNRARQTVASRRLSLVLAFAVGLAGSGGVRANPPGPTQDRTASAAYCARDLGAWFYCDRVIETPQATLAPADDPPKNPAQDQALAAFEAFKTDLDSASKLAVWDPTPENVERFFRLQQLALNQSSLFSDEYRRLVWAKPELDYSLKRPVSELGKRDWTETRAADRELFLKRISGGVGLFYVFRGNCGPCRVFSPIIHDFANRYALEVRGVSVDGSANPAIATSFVDRGQLRSWGIDNPTTPSVLLFQNSSLDPQTGEVRKQAVRLSDDRVVEVAPCLKPRGCLTYVGAGVMSQEDIVERIYVMLATKPGEDY